MWKCIQEGECVLIEMPSRWYVGVVADRSSVTFTLAEALCGHDLGDLGLFLDGKAAAQTGAELTPLPRPIELNLGSVDSAQRYPVAYLEKLRKRTHSPQGQAVES